MPKGDRYCCFSQRQFEEFLGVQPDGKPIEKGGFHRISVPGTVELVYAKKVGRDLSLRVYSTIQGGFARTKDSDAIRIMIVWRPSEDEQALMIKDGVIDEDARWPMTVGGETKVLRVLTWRENLADRLKNYEEIMPPRCGCGCPKVLKKPKKRKGQNWEPFWGCVLYMRCPLKTGVQQSRPAPAARTETRTQPRQVKVTPAATARKWDELPPWQTIPVERRRPGSKIPYDQTPY